MPKQSGNGSSTMSKEAVVTSSRAKENGICSIFGECFETTTAHGLPRVVRSGPVFIRLFWSMAFVGFSALMIFFIARAFIAYFDYPTSIDTTIISERPQYFPAFSFCNLSPFRWDLLLGPFLNFASLNNLNVTIETLSTQNQFSNLAQFLIYAINNNITIDPFVFQLSSMLQTCMFNNVPCDATDFIPFTSAVYGACYTFNAKLKNDSSQNLRYVNQDGGDGKLTLGLYIHRQLYVPYLADGFGIVSLIHDNTQLPLIEAAGIELAPGRRHRLGYSRKTTYLLSAPYTSCATEISFSMQAMFDNYNDADYSYSETICYQLCGQVYAYEKCGCVNPYLWNARKLYIPSIDRVVVAPLCGINSSCYFTNIGELLTSKPLMDDYCSQCSPECLIRNYLVTPSSSSTPADWQMADIKKFVENSSLPLPSNWSTTWYEEIQKNYVTINVVCQTSIVENNTQSATIAIVDLLSNIGGQTGLWVGVSFLSLMEVFEILYLLIQQQYFVVRRMIQRFTN